MEDTTMTNEEMINEQPSFPSEEYQKNMEELMEKLKEFAVQGAAYFSSLPRVPLMGSEAEIQYLKNLLSASDYKVIKEVEAGRNPGETIPDIVAYRQSLRDRINELEATYK